MSCEIYIPDSKPLFSEFFNNKENIENELSEQLEWEELPDKKASRIILRTNGDFFQIDNWEMYHSWMLDKVTDFQNVFGKYVKLSSII